MNMEKYASFHVLVLAFTYLRPCGDMSNRRMSGDLSRLQACSTAALQPGLFGLYIRGMHVSAFSPIWVLGVVTRDSFQPETMSMGCIMTQALVPFFVSWFTVNPTVALHEVMPADGMTMNVLFIGLALFGVQSG